MKNATKQEHRGAKRVTRQRVEKKRPLLESSQAREKWRQRTLKRIRAQRRSVLMTTRMSFVRSTPSSSGGPPCLLVTCRSWMLRPHPCSARTVLSKTARRTWRHDAAPDIATALWFQDYEQDMVNSNPRTATETYSGHGGSRDLKTLHKSRVYNVDGTSGRYEHTLAHTRGS